jgi:hypothetical protein
MKVQKDIATEYLTARKVIGEFIIRECCKVRDHVRDDMAAVLIADLANHDPPLLIESPPKWLDEPAGDGWYWIKPLKHDGIYLTELLHKNPCYVYWSAKKNHWRFNHSWVEGHDAAQGRQVCPIEEPPQ